jgi:hypothetical protein
VAQDAMSLYLAVLLFFALTPGATVHDPPTVELIPSAVVATTEAGCQAIVQRLAGAGLAQVRTECAAWVSGAQGPLRLVLTERRDRLELASALPFVTLCRSCGAPSTDHLPLVTADSRLIGRSLVGECARFEAAA